MAELPEDAERMEELPEEGPGLRTLGPEIIIRKRPLLTRDPSFYVKGRSVSGSSANSPLGPFMGIKPRSLGSARQVFQGDYLSLCTNYALLKLMTKQGDQSVLFADVVMKINRRNEPRKCLLVITEAALYLLHATTFRCKRRIPLPVVEALCLSELEDHFFGVLVREDTDVLLASTRKTEIVTVLVEATKSFGLELNVEFKNSFTFRSSPQLLREVKFEQVEGGVRTTLFALEQLAE